MRYKIFFSVFNGSLSDNDNHRKIFNQLKALNPIPVHGSYNSVPEKSMLVFSNNGSKMQNTIESIARQFNQESILLVEQGSGAAYLKYLSTNILERIGTMVQVNQLEALSQSAYSEINGKYWIVK